VLLSGLGSCTCELCVRMMSAPRLQTCSEGQVSPHCTSHAAPATTLPGRRAYLRRLTRRAAALSTRLGLVVSPFPAICGLLDVLFSRRVRGRGGRSPDTPNS
jgi:hypothetical protein